MTREEVDRREFEAKLIGDLLDRIVSAERAILRRINCPTDLAAIEDILTGKQPAPWPKATAARDIRRARLAMFALGFAAQARPYLGPNPARENPRMAAYYALQAGACAGDIVITADDAAFGVSRRRQVAEWSSKGVAERKRASDPALAEAVLLYLRKHPTHSNSTIAANLLTRFGRSDDRVKAIDALRQRVKRIRSEASSKKK